MNTFRNERYGLPFFNENNAVGVLILINVVSFLMLFTIEIIYRIIGIDTLVYIESFFNWLALPSSLSKFITRPWALFTHFFIEFSFLKFLANMLWLSFFATLFQNICGNKRVIPLYIYGSFAAGIAFILFQQILPLKYSNTFFYGNGAGIMALAIAATVYVPEYKIFPMIKGGISLWIITAVYVLISIAGVATSLPILLAIAFSGLIGFVFAKQLQSGKDRSEWLNRLWDSFINLFNPDKKIVHNTIKQKNFYNTNGKAPYKKSPLINQSKIDALLDKISQQGYDALTEEEKNILKRASELDNN